MSDFTPLLAVGGNSSAARSARARLQWRDRYGRWIEMGRGANFSLRLRNGKTVSVNGRFVGVAEDNNFGQVYVKGDVSGIPDGFYEVSSSNAEKIGATLDAGYLAKQGIDADTVIERPRSASEIQDENTIVREDAPAGWVQTKNVGGGFNTDDMQFEIIPEGNKNSPQFALINNGREVGSYKTLPEAFVSASKLDRGEKATNSTAPTIAKDNQPGASASETSGYEVREASDEGFLVPTGNDSETVSAEAWSADPKAALANYVKAHKASLSEPGRRLVADMNDDGSVTFDSADHVATKEEADALSTSRASTPEEAGNVEAPRNSDAVEPSGDDGGADRPVGGDDTPDAGQDTGGESSEVERARADATAARLEAVNAKLDTINAKLDRNEARDTSSAADVAPEAEAPATPDVAEAPTDSYSDDLNKAIMGADGQSDSAVDRAEWKGLQKLKRADTAGTDSDEAYATLTDDEKKAQRGKIKERFATPAAEVSPEPAAEAEPQPEPEPAPAAPEFKNPYPFVDTEKQRWGSKNAYVEDTGGKASDLTNDPRTREEYDAERPDSMSKEEWDLPVAKSTPETRQEPEAGAPVSEPEPEPDTETVTETPASEPAPVPTPEAEAPETAPVDRVIPEWEASGIEAAKAYDAMEHDPSNEDVQQSYTALEEAVMDQYREMKASGMDIVFSEDDPYADSASMLADVRDNNRLATFADAGATLPVNHPMNKKVVIDGEELHLNDVFRAVHDYFGHVKSGDRGAVVSFGPKGEWEAWRTHRLTLPQDSWPALWNETRGQNTWTNYNGDNNSLPLRDRPFAEQKAGVVGEDIFAADLTGDEPKAPELDEMRAPTIGDERIKRPVNRPSFNPTEDLENPESDDQGEVQDLISEYQDRLDRANAGEDSDGVTAEEAQRTIDSLQERVVDPNVELEAIREEVASIGAEMQEAITSGDFGSIPDIQSRLTERLDRINELQAQIDNAVDVPESEEQWADEDETNLDLARWADEEAQRLEEALTKTETGEPTLHAELIEVSDPDLDNPEGRDLDVLPATKGDAPEVDPTPEQVVNSDVPTPEMSDQEMDRLLPFKDSDEDYADMKFMPTAQQRLIVRSVLSGNDTAVEALAGTGKTSTLELIARRLKAVDPDKKILYIAFNKSVQTEAEGRMPDNVIATTGDGLSWNSLGRELVKKADSRSNRDLLGIPSEIASEFGITRTKDSTAVDNVRDIQKVIKKFNTSDRDELSQIDFEEAEVEFSDQKFAWAKDMWRDIANPNGRMKISNDHVTKLWALSNPDFTKGVTGSKGRGITPDIIFFDEAQDVNPVMAKIVREQNEKVQKVYVGDTNQAIYAFRGAVDELQKVNVDIRLPLTESWRFGPEVAGMGNRFLAFSGAKHRVVGGGKNGEIVPSSTMTDADAVLTRSNGGAMKAILQELENGRTVGVTENFKKSLTSAIDSIEILQRGRTRRDSLHEDFQGYQTWQEVLDDIEKDKAPARVVMYNNLVNNYGVPGLKDALRKVVVSGKEVPGDAAPEGTLAENELRPGLKFKVSPSGIVSLSGNTWPHKDDIKNTRMFRWNPNGKTWDSREQDEAGVQKTLDSLRQGGSAVPEKIDVVVVTAHQSKGLEWDNVRIGDDFRGPRNVKDPETGEDVLEMPDPEEIRLAYVAVTRAAKRLDPGALDWIRDYTSDEDEDPNSIRTDIPEGAPRAAEGDAGEILEPDAVAGELPDFVAPEGKDLPDFDEPFDMAEVERPVDAPDTWTADPIDLAETHDRKELEDALTEAVQSSEGASVIIDGVDTPVDTRVVYEAVNEAGGDPRRVVAEALDELNGDDTNQKNLGEAYTDAPDMAPEGFVPPVSDEDTNSSTPGRSPARSTIHENEELDTPIALDPEPYEPEGTGIDGTSDDPDVIADNFPVADLEETFKDAVENGNADVRLIFGGDEKAPEANVPVEAVRDAIQKHGKDTNRIIRDVLRGEEDVENEAQSLDDLLSAKTPEDSDSPISMRRLDNLRRRVNGTDNLTPRQRDVIEDLLAEPQLTDYMYRRITSIVGTPTPSDDLTPINTDSLPQANRVADVFDPNLVLEAIQNSYGVQKRVNEGEMVLNSREHVDSQGNRKTYELGVVRTGNEFFYVYEREINHVTGEARSRRVSRMAHSSRALANQIDLANARFTNAKDIRSRFNASRGGRNLIQKDTKSENGNWATTPEEPIYAGQIDAILNAANVDVSNDVVRAVRDRILREGISDDLRDSVANSISLTPEQADDLIGAINEYTILSDTDRGFQTWASADGRTPLLEGDRIQYENEETGEIRFGVVQRRIAKRDSKDYAYSDNVNIKWDDPKITNSDIISRRLTLLQTAQGTDGSERRGAGWVVPQVGETRRAEVRAERFKPAGQSTAPVLNDGDGTRIDLGDREVVVSGNPFFSSARVADTRADKLAVGDKMIIPNAETGTPEAWEVIGYEAKVTPKGRVLSVNVKTARINLDGFNATVRDFKFTPAMKLRVDKNTRPARPAPVQESEAPTPASAPTPNPSTFALTYQIRRLREEGKGRWTEGNDWDFSAKFNRLEQSKDIAALTQLRDELLFAKENYTPVVASDKWALPAPGERREAGVPQGVDLKKLRGLYRETQWGGAGGGGENQLNLAIWQQIGFDALPEVLMEEEFDSSVWYRDSSSAVWNLEGRSEEEKANAVDDQGNQKLVKDGKNMRFFRGLGQNQDEGLRYQIQLMYGEVPYSGLGLIGDGTYFTSRAETAETFGNGIVKEFFIDPDAVGVTYAELMQYRADMLAAINNKEFGDLSTAEYLVLKQITSNMGTLAAFLGFDYINGTGDSGLQEIVLQNRGKLKVKK